MNLEILRRKRLKWVRASRENHFEDGIKRFLTNLYPDSAHFIYELLQNAEDAQAKEVRFNLKDDLIEFEHDGSRMFLIDDVVAITSIGNNHKTDNPTNIGKFGVGFKAVFAYTSTPEIKSGAYHFRIRDLVIPDSHGLTSDGLSEVKTQFFLPFNNPEKSKEKACAEIERELRALDESTLIFLSNICKIEYILPNSEIGYLVRNESLENRIEVLVKHPDDTEPVSNTYLRFRKDVEVIDEDGSYKRCRIATAYGLEHNPRQNWKIKPLNRGQVCIYFPALKEHANLKFHLHAPFASTVARDSVRDCEANDNLRDELAQLIAESMSIIRAQGLLTVEFLSILPNDKDNLSSFYNPIMTGLIKAFQNEELVPMKRGGHAAAHGIFRGTAQLANLVTDRDLATIQGGDCSRPMWIANPSQRNQRSDSFLSMLNISEWSTCDLIGILTKGVKRIDWLAGKSHEWHQEMYSLLGEYLERLQKQQKYQWDPYSRDYRPSNSIYQDTKYSLSEAPIVRLCDGTYKKGRDCFFPSDGVVDDEVFSRVTPEVYAYGNDEKQKKEARGFLEEIGVKELDESHRVEAILKERYSNDCAGSIDKDRYLKDLRRFIRLIKEHPDQSKLFKQYYIFWSEDKKWRTPVQCYLDLSVHDTGLRAYFEAVVDKPPKKLALAQFYETSGLEIETLREFAEAVGVQENLTIIKQKIPWSHPERQILMSFPDSRRTYTGINYDYDIEELAILLEHPTKEKAKLIWRTLCTLSDECLYARYRPNQQYAEKVGAASFVHSLRKAVWVPQDNDKGLLFTTPGDARVEFLPPGFQYERGQMWLEAIEFGNRPSSTTEDSPQMAQAAEFLGTDQEGLVRVQEFLQLSPETQQEALDEMLRKEHNEKLPKLPDQDSTNPKRRTSRTAAEYQNAPAKEYETRDRSVRTSKVDNDKATYLRRKYTNEDDQMICQICVKEMPFKKRNGDYYFEAVEPLSGDYISKEHVAQCIALCPTCAARYQEFVKKDDSAMQSLFDVMKGSIEPVISIKLGEWDTSIRFVKTHWLEMKAILKSVE